MYGNKRKFNTAGGRVSEARSGYGSARDSEIHMRGLDGPPPEHLQGRPSRQTADWGPTPALGNSAGRVSYGERMDRERQSSNAGYAGRVGKRRQSGGPYPGGN